MDGPRLIENNFKNYLYNTLQGCHETRTKIYYIILNFSVLVLFLGIVGITLYYCYNKKLSPYEKHQKHIKDQEYILSKIRFYQTQMQSQSISSSNITSLPTIPTENSSMFV